MKNRFPIWMAVLFSAVLTMAFTFASPASARYDDDERYEHRRYGERYRYRTNLMPQGDVAITIAAHRFTAPDITVRRGSTITWVNQEGVRHTVTARDGAFNASLRPGQSVTLDFPRRGTFYYFCRLHPHMRGVVRVR